MPNLKNHREKMQDIVARTLGLENEGTIWFYDLCEQYEDNQHNNEKLFDIMAALLELSQYANELE